MREAWGLLVAVSPNESNKCMVRKGKSTIGGVMPQKVNRVRVHYKIVFHLIN